MPTDNSQKPQHTADIMGRFFPNAKLHGTEWRMGSINGEAGESLCVTADGLWIDHATDEGGDIYHLYANAEGLQREQGYQHYMQTYVTPLPQAKPRLVKTIQYQYDGFEIKRLEFSDGSKSFNSAAAPSHNRPLYRIDDASLQGTVIVVEGEKCVDYLQSHNMTATTSLGGANVVDRTDWKPLKNKKVLIWRDNDAAGMKYENAVIAQLQNIASAVKTLDLPTDLPPKWDAADCDNPLQFLQDTPRLSPKTKMPRGLQVFALSDLVANPPPVPDDIISPRILTPEGMLVVAGPAKLGKSHVMLQCLLSLSCGNPFLDMEIANPQRVLYAQAELDMPYLYERIGKQYQHFSPAQQQLMKQNFFCTPKFYEIFDKKTLDTIAGMIAHYKIDILVIDPLRNVYDAGGDIGGENSNTAMQNFLKAVSSLGVTTIIIHHTKKSKPAELHTNKFEALSGANALHCFCSAGILLVPALDDDGNIIAGRIHMYFDIRNGKAIPSKVIMRHDDEWEVDASGIS